MKVLGLFSGLGCFELGMQRAGHDIAAMCEIEPYCRKVLARHWPDRPIFEDVRELSGEGLATAGIVPDIITGGFPCQDISCAGTRSGITADRSGLWFEMARVVGEVRPRFVVVENVADLLFRGLGDVLGALAGIGYDAEWSVVSACAMGAPHMRRRLFILAYPRGQCGPEGLWHTATRPAGALQARNSRPDPRAGWLARMEDPSALYGDADGAANRLERNRALGNAIVPDIAEMIGLAIKDFDDATRRAA